MNESLSSGIFKVKKKSYSNASRGKPILVTGRRKVTEITNVIIDGADLTPKPLNPAIFTSGKERQLDVHDIGVERYGLSDFKTSHSANFSALRSQSTVRFKADFDKLTTEVGSVIAGSRSYGSTLTDIQTPELSIETEGSDKPSGSAPSIDGSEDEATDIDIMVTRKIPTHVSLILNETETFFLVDIPSSTVEKDTDEGILVEEDNLQYVYLTEGKGRNRKVLHAEIQTVPVMSKARHTFCPKAKTKSNYTFASNWEMYDTYENMKERKMSSSSDGSDDTLTLEGLEDETSSMDSYRMSADERQFGKLLKNPRFLEAVCVTERLLANNCYNKEQKIFRGLTIQDDFRENIQYKYKLNFLWTFSNENTKGKSVNSLHWNPTNKDILAVGYGKFYFTDTIPGLVLIWNIKNPKQPERCYKFQESVTSVRFSSSNPTLLAVGTSIGSVTVINIASRELLIIGENSPTFESAWDISWLRNTKDNREKVVAVFDDGYITSYNIGRKLEPSHLMRIAKATGKLKGYDSMRKCSNINMPVTSYSAALLNRPHPSSKSIYFIGTDEGVIHKCSYNYLNRHLDLFLAHEGPINEMKFSPFCPTFFATCGDDWHTRIWAEGISKPLLDFYVMMQSVQGLDWSPTHSTILVTIQGNQIQVWDLQRKVYCPQSITISQAGTRNTVIQFTDTGKSLIVGDIDGNVHVYSLEDMPFPAFFQANLMFESISRALITNPPLTAKVKKLRKHSFASN